MPPARRRGGRRRRGGGGGPSTVRLSKGRVVIRVGGFPGTQKLAPAVLIRKIAKKHIKKAASAVLRGTKRGSGRVKKRGRRRRGGKRRRGRGRVRRSKRRRTRKRKI